MQHAECPRPARLSVVIPCYNEEHTLETCVQRVLAIADANLVLELIIVDDHSSDHSPELATRMARRHPEIKVIHHQRNQGKGAALRSGFKLATGDFVAVQDADLEYDPHDLKRLVALIADGKADVVLGSRFLSTGAHRVLHFWHSVGNHALTFLSNMLTDLNLTDMETCYKVFRREILQNIEIEENRFGFEPEIIAKLAQQRVRIYEMGISYYGRTYAEGKKIGLRDGLRALYCILRYNAPKAPLPLQLVLNLLCGTVTAGVNLSLFLSLTALDLKVVWAAPIAFGLMSVLDYVLCVKILFRKEARWSTITVKAVFIFTVLLTGLVDLSITVAWIANGGLEAVAKLMALLAVWPLNFIARRFVIFAEPPVGPWRPQNP